MPCSHSPCQPFPLCTCTNAKYTIQTSRLAVNVNKSWSLGVLSYLSVLCRISFPFFHRLIAGGQAWGLHSRVTSLPKRAFSKAFSGFLEKLGGEAVQRITWLKKGNQNVRRSAALTLILSSASAAWVKSEHQLCKSPDFPAPPAPPYAHNPPSPRFSWLSLFVRPS